MGWHRVGNQMSPYLQARRLQTPCLVLRAHTQKSPSPHGAPSEGSKGRTMAQD